MPGLPFDVQVLDEAQSIARVGGLLVVHVERIPQAAGVRRLVAAVKKDPPWAVLQVFEIERLGLPDEATRDAYGEFMRTGDGVFQGVALVAERAMLQSIVRSVTSGLRLLNRPKTPMQTFSTVVEASLWLASRRPQNIPRVEVPTVEEALEILRKK